MTAPLPQVSVVVLSLNGAKVIGDCLESLLASDYPNFEVIVVNNGSTDATASIVRERFPSFSLIDLPRNLGFAGGNNEGLRAAKGEILIVLNDDTIVRPDIVREMVRPFERDAMVGIVGCKILYPDGKTIQHAGTAMLPNGLTRHIGYGEEDKGQYDEEREMDYVTGAAMAIRRKVLEEIGLFDDRYFPIYFEEVEMAHRARRAGWKVVYAPRASLLHLESQTQVSYSPKFLLNYNRCRWRFILKNFSARQIWRAIKFELKWLRDLPREPYLKPMTRAYLATVARLPIILYDRRRRRIPK